MKNLISVLLVVVFTFSLFSLSAFAVAGDVSGSFQDFPVWYESNNRGIICRPVSNTNNFAIYSHYVSNTTQGRFTVLYAFPNDVLSGSVTHLSFTPSGVSVDSLNYVSFSTYNVEGVLLESSEAFLTYPFSFTFSSPNVRFLCVTYIYNFTNSNLWHQLYDYNRSLLTYSDFVYASSSGSVSDDDILDGITAIAQSLYDLETGPYYGVSGVTLDENGDLQHTLTQNDSLEDLLNALGIAGTDSNHVIRGIYNNFGSYFTLYSIDDSTSSTTHVYRGLPQYVNALGQSVTDGINRLQRDNNLLYNSISSLSSSQSEMSSMLKDALYENSNSLPVESWSVAKWLKGIYIALSDFVSNFWSPGESALKDASEDAYQELADSDLVISDTDVSSWSSFSSSLPGFVDSGVSPNELLRVPSEDWFSEFWSDTTLSNLSAPSNTRGSKSSSTPFLDANSSWLSRMFGGEKGESR